MRIKDIVDLLVSNINNGNINITYESSNTGNIIRCTIYDKKENIYHYINFSYDLKINYYSMFVGFHERPPRYYVCTRDNYEAMLEAYRKCASTNNSMKYIYEKIASLIKQK